MMCATRAQTASLDRRSNIKVDVPIPIPYSIDSCLRPTPSAREDTFHIGNNTTRAFHKLYSYRGVVYCTQCGAGSGVNHIRKLSKPCVPAGPNSFGQVTIDRMNAGRKPIGLASWVLE